MAPWVPDESWCSRCRGPNVVWAAPSPLWNQVMRGGSINGPETYDGFVCPTCFAQLAELAGVATLWRLSAERVNVELETTTPSGRVWNERTWLFEEPAERDRTGPPMPDSTTWWAGAPGPLCMPECVAETHEIAPGVTVLLDGSGVVAGVRVEPHPLREVRTRYVLEPGEDFNAAVVRTLREVQGGPRVPDEAVEAFDGAHTLASVTTWSEGLRGWPRQQAMIRAGLDAAYPILAGVWADEAVAAVARDARLASPPSVVVPDPDDDDFFEEDEPIENIRAQFAAGVPFVTAGPEGAP